MIIGIDLGTTNSAAAVWRDGEAVLIPNALGDVLTPSAVSLNDAGELLVGIAARDRQSTHPQVTATAFKRLMGTEQKLQFGKMRMSPEELSALVLGTLKRDAEAFLGVAVDGAVITVPAYFNEEQRRATKRAGEMAGLAVERLLNEPTAAALAYGIHQAEDDDPFLVFDLGGGTFDVSLVQMFDGVIEVRSSSGDPRLGGIDFNMALAQVALAKLPAEIQRDAGDAVLRSKIEEAAERARRELSSSDQARFALAWQGNEFSAEISSSEFETAAAPLIERLREPVLRSLRDGNTRASELGEIVLVGGATRMPLVRKAVTRLFGRFASQRLHPDHAIALGAAVQAGLRENGKGLEEIRLTDVCPFTLGVDVAERDRFGNLHEGIFSPIIERNRAIPTSRVRYYHTLMDNQHLLEFNVYQGEAREVKANVKLANIKVPVPRRPAGEIAVECRFTYDVSGLLEVDVHVPETGERRQVVIGGADLSAKEMIKKRAMLAALKVHPKDDARNAALLARAERCYENHIGEMRDHIGHMTLAFVAVLERQDPREIDDAHAAFEAALNEIEGERYL